MLPCSDLHSCEFFYIKILIVIINIIIYCYYVIVLLSFLSKSPPIT